MKRLGWILVLMFAIMSARAQNAQNATVQDSRTAAEAAAKAQRQLEAERRVKAALEGKVVIYGGFLTELSAAESKSKFLSLRQPRDPKNDAKYLYLDERTGRPKGFVLFSIGF